MTYVYVILKNKFHLDFKKFMRFDFAFYLTIFKKIFRCFCHELKVSKVCNCSMFDDKFHLKKALTRKAPKEYLQKYLKAKQEL